MKVNKNPNKANGKKSCKPPTPTENKQKYRLEKQRDTIHLINNNQIPNLRKRNHNCVSYNNQQEVKFFIEQVQQNQKQGQKYDTTYCFLNKDSLDAAIELQNNINDNIINNGKTNIKIAIHIFANDTNPGGGYLKGANGQEENICRRTNLSISITSNSNNASSSNVNSNIKNIKKSNKVAKDNVNSSSKKLYPIPEFGCLYVQDLGVFRKNEEFGYEVIPVEFVAGILCAAYSHPLLKENELKLENKYEQGMKNKIRQLLFTALVNGHVDIVLGGWGTGAYGIPAEIIASLFWEQLESKKGFKGCFRNVVFAVKNNNKTLRTIESFFQSVS
eukprot:Pgem_evm1s16016